MEHQEPKQNGLRTTQNAGANQGAEGPSLRHKVTTGLFWTYAERILAQIVTTVVSLVWRASCRRMIMARSRS